MVQVDMKPYVHVGDSRGPEGTLSYLLYLVLQRPVMMSCFFSVFLVGDGKDL